jgi:ketosteroid isomerase-like protein
VFDSDLDAAIEAHRQALRAYAKGDPEPVLTDWSMSDDATLANPYGPPCRGRASIEAATRQAVGNFQEGGPFHFEEVNTQFDEMSRGGTANLGYVVQLEQHVGKDHWSRGARNSRATRDDDLSA